MFKVEIWVCSICGYEYNFENGDLENGIVLGIKFEDLLDDWVCFICGVGKDMFEKK